DAWQACGAARGAGIDVRAVTVWALLGSRDWDGLLTRHGDHYEPGAFDVRNGRRRPTAIARLARELATGTAPAHPVLSGPGWWARPRRLLHPRVDMAEARDAVPDHPGAPARPLLITGASGTLGRAFARICTARGLAHRLLDRTALDIADPASV